MFVCLCVCVCVCLVFAHHQFCMCGAITEIRPCNNNGCPRLSAHILCQDNKLKEKECDEHSHRKGGGTAGGGKTGKLAGGWRKALAK